MPKYRLLAGSHTEGKNELNEPILFSQGEVFHSKLNLMVLNKPGSTKFEMVPDDTPVTNQATSKEKSATAVAVAEPEDDGLEKITVTDLKRLANEEEIDLDNTMSKSEIISCIRLARDVS